MLPPLLMRDTYSRPEPRWWRAVFPGLTRAVPHHLTVDGTADTVVQLHIELGQHIRCNTRGTDLTGRSHEKVVAIHEGHVWNLQSKTLASEMSLTAAASTMFLITNFLMALSLGTQRAQLVQRMGCTWPRPFLARPLFLLFLVYQMQIPETNYSKSSRKHTIYRFYFLKEASWV